MVAHSLSSMILPGQEDHGRGESDHLPALRAAIHGAAGAVGAVPGPDDQLHEMRPAIRRESAAGSAAIGADSASPFLFCGAAPHDRAEPLCCSGRPRRVPAALRAARLWLSAIPAALTPDEWLGDCRTGLRTTRV